MSKVPDNINAEITPREFENLIKEFLSDLGKDLKSFNASHDVKLLTSDGEYQIDVIVTFEALNVDFTILVECKKHKNKIKRDVVQLLYDKIRTIGANKGIIFSTSGFQKGAELFAKEHSIALIRVIEGRYTYFTKSFGDKMFEIPPWADIPKFVGEFKYKSSINYLEVGYMDPLKEFLFEK
jgi:restriction system protein